MWVCSSLWHGFKDCEATKQKLVSNCTSTFSIGKYCDDQSRNVDMSVAVQDKVCWTCLCASERMAACGDGSYSRLSYCYMFSCPSSTAPEAPEGSKWERNMPPPPHVSLHGWTSKHVLVGRGCYTGTLNRMCSGGGWVGGRRAQGLCVYVCVCVCACVREEGVLTGSGNA